MEGVLVSPRLTASEIVVELKPAAVLLVGYEGEMEPAGLEVISASGSGLVRELFVAGKKHRLELPIGRVTVKSLSWVQGTRVDLSEQTVELVAGEETELVLSDS